MNPQLAQQTLTFLARTDIKGQEAPAFMACVSAIQAMAAPAADALQAAVPQ